MKDKESDKGGSPTLKSSWRLNATSMCRDFMTTPGERATRRGVSTKTEVERILSEVICSITDVASE